MIFCTLTTIRAEENNDSDEETIGTIGGYLYLSTYASGKLTDEARFYKNINGGHGFVAENANNLIDVLKGKNAKVVGGDNVENGADRIIQKRNGAIIQIQDKYYSTALESVNAAFDENGYRYLTSDNSPMLLEVPKDQYDDAVKAFAKKIEEGKVPGVSDPKEASNIVKKGNITYEQARNLTKAGNIDSLIYDAANGAIISATVMGITFAIDFAISILNGNSIDESLKSASLASLKTGALTEIIYVLSSQLAKTTASTIFTPAASSLANVLGPSLQETIVSLFGKEGSKVTKDAVTNALSNQLLIQAVTFVVMSVPDVVDCFSGRISAKQLAINLATLIGGMAGTTVGAIAGGALGNLIVPGVGTTIGEIAGGAVGGVLGSWGTSTLLTTVFQTDAENMYDIITEEFQKCAENYMITQDEADDIIDKLQAKLETDTLKDMFQSDDRNQFADNLLIPLFEEKIAQRDKIEIPSENEARNSLIEQLSEVVYIH
jgi:hypothetical protein